MARPKIYFAWNVPRGVVNIVRTLCADYERRVQAIERGTVSDGIGGTYAMLNEAIDLALVDIDPNLRKDFLADIAYHRGYDYAQVSPYLAKNTYYAKKRKFVYEVAKKLLLIE